MDPAPKMFSNIAKIIHIFSRMIKLTETSALIYNGRICSRTKDLPRKT